MRLFLNGVYCFQWFSSTNGDCSHKSRCDLLNWPPCGYTTHLFDWYMLEQPDRLEKCVFCPRLPVEDNLSNQPMLITSTATGYKVGKVDNPMTFPSAKNVYFLSFQQKNPITCSYFTYQLQKHSNKTLRQDVTQSASSNASSNAVTASWSSCPFIWSPTTCRRHCSPSALVTAAAGRACGESHLLCREKGWVSLTSLVVTVIHSHFAICGLETARAFRH